MIKKITIICLIAAVFSACAGAPGGNARPGWTLNPPADSVSEMYFVGIGSDGDGIITNAEEYAASSVVKQVTEYLGVEIRSTTSMEARSTLETLQVDMVEQIQQKSAARIAEFKIIERWEEVTETGAINIYLLASYGKSALEQEKARLEQLFAEREEAVSGPELEGDTLAAAGDFFPAVVQYLTAASNAVNSDLENKKIKYRRNMTKATEALQQLQVFLFGAPDTGFIGEAFSEPFTVKATYASSAGGPGVEGIPFRVTYKVLKNNGKKGLAYAGAISDADGIASFSAPVPDFTGDEVVTLAVDLRESLEFTDEVPSELASSVESLETVLLSKKVKIPYTVESAAKYILTAVHVADYDEKGNFIAEGSGSRGLVDALSGAGFSLKVIPVRTSLKGKEHAALLKSVSGQTDGAFQRVVLGTIGIVDVTESRGSVVLGAEGSVAVYDTVDGSLLYSVTKRKSFVGDSVDAVRKSVFSGMGELLADDLKNSLP